MAEEIGKAGVNGDEVMMEGDRDFVLALERVPILLVMFSWVPSNVWTLLVPSIVLLFLCNLLYIGSYRYQDRTSNQNQQEIAKPRGNDDELVMDDIDEVLVLERVPILLVMFCWVPSNVWTFLFPAILLLVLCNLMYIGSYLDRASNQNQQLCATGDLYQTVSEEFEEKCHRCDEEKCKLIAELDAATTVIQLDRELLHDVDNNLTFTC